MKRPPLSLHLKMARPKKVQVGRLGDKIIKNIDERNK